VDVTNQGRHAMNRFESLAFTFCAGITALLTVATLAPVA
jgi:hypothetical protein